MVKGLARKSTAPCAERRNRRCHAGRAGDDDRAGERMAFSQGGQELGAVAVRQIQVDDQQIDGLSLDDLAGLGEGGRGGEPAIDVAAEGIADEIDHVEFVVDDQDPGRSGRCCLRRLSNWGHARSKKLSKTRVASDAAKQSLGRVIF